MVFDGYFTGFNQTRGVSPLLAAMNDVIDLHDIKLYSKTNLKLRNLFGLAVFRESGDALGGATTANEERIAAGQQAEVSPEKINILDLNANDKVQAFETNSPGANSMEFMGLLARVAMLALDIPYTSLDSSRASFSARIGDWAEYAESAEAKREQNMDVLLEIYAWRTAAWYKENEQFRDAAKAAGYDVGMLVRGLDIIPAATPYMDPLDELKAAALEMSLGLASTPMLARKRGRNAYHVAAEQARYLAWAKEQGLPIFYASGGQPAVQNILDEPRRGEPAPQSGDGQ
jgi:capsid protein